MAGGKSSSSPSSSSSASGSSSSGAKSTPSSGGGSGSNSSSLIPAPLLSFHNQMPSYYYVIPVLLVFWSLLYLTGFLSYYICYLILCFFISPYASWQTTTHLFWRCLFPFKGYPILFNLTPMSIILSRVFLIFPFETIFYYLDELLFSGYKKVQIKDPFLIVGQPRSGTTKLESILEADEDLICLKMREIRWPYISMQYLFDLVGYIDSHYLTGAIDKFMKDWKLLSVFDETDPERHNMRRIRYDLADEDDVIFLCHFFIHFQLLGPFPDPKMTHYIHHFDELAKLERTRMLNFHKRAVQKVLYRRGAHKRYFAKWVLSWCGVTQEAFEVYPDLKLLVMTRDPQDQLRSWFKLQSLLSRDLSGVNVLERSPEVLAELKKINIEFYNNEIALLGKLDPSRRLIFNFQDYYKDIQNNTRLVYDFLDKTIVSGSKFEKFLAEQTQQQLTHKATATDDNFFTTQEIKQNFPDLPAVLGKLEDRRPKTQKEE